MHEHLIYVESTNSTVPEEPLLWETTDDYFLNSTSSVSLTQREGKMTTGYMMISKGTVYLYRL